MVNYIFSKYNEIQNDYKKSLIDTIKEEINSDEEWVVLEKIHGCNFSFTHFVETNEILPGKRNGFLYENDQFYDYKQVFEDIRHSILKATDYIKCNSKTLFSNDETIEAVTIYGELFGGYYPNLNETTNKPIQSGVYYGPNIMFRAFDISVRFETNKLSKKYLDWDICLKVFLHSGINYVPELLRGKFDEVLLDVETLITKIPDMLGLPPISDNIAEGVVMKPIKTFYLKKEGRCILKKKSKKFLERPRKVKEIPKDAKESELNKLLQTNVIEYINNARFNNMISKIGIEESKKFQQKFLGLFVQDVLNDFTKDNEEYYKINPQEKKIFKKNVMQLCQNFILTEFKLMSL
jgi:Rnl2 family RNA ligase